MNSLILRVVSICFLTFVAERVEANGFISCFKGLTAIHSHSISERLEGLRGKEVEIENTRGTLVRVARGGYENDSIVEAVIRLPNGREKNFVVFQENNGKTQTKARKIQVGKQFAPLVTRDNSDFAVYEALLKVPRGETIRIDEQQGTIDNINFAGDERTTTLSVSLRLPDGSVEEFSLSQSFVLSGPRIVDVKVRSGD